MVPPRGRGPNYEWGVNDSMYRVEMLNAFIEPPPFGVSPHGLRFCGGYYPAVARNVARRLNDDANFRHAVARERPITWEAVHS